MYYFVPAIVSIIIFWVLSPKSASFISGNVLPGTYLVFSSIFYGLRSRWVIRWLCNSCTPLLICRTHCRPSRWFILLSLQRLRASLTMMDVTIGIHLNSTRWCTIRHLVDRWYRIFSVCFRSILFVIINLSVSTCWCLQDRPRSCVHDVRQASHWWYCQRHGKPRYWGHNLSEISLSDKFSFCKIELFFEELWAYSHLNCY
jgi:hypothetical protein